MRRDDAIEYDGIGLHLLFFVLVVGPLFRPLCRTLLLRAGSFLGWLDCITYVWEHLKLERQELFFTQPNFSTNSTAKSMLVLNQVICFHNMYSVVQGLGVYSLCKCGFYFVPHRCSIVFYQGID